MISNELGLPKQKFDCILVSAAADEFPYELVSQLKNGAKLIIPIKNSINEIRKKESGELEAVEHYGFRFVSVKF